MLDNDSKQFPHIFRPIELNNIILKNRLMMGSMHTGLEEERDLHELSQFYAERVQGGVGLIVTGGIAPNRAGRLTPFAAKLSNHKEMKKLASLADTVHQHDGRIALQILHSGRYGYHPLSVAPSPIKSPISPFKPWKLSHRGVLKTIKHFARCTRLAKQAGFDGVEIMGSEGYLINQFLTTHTNHRNDRWGGTYEQRMRFPVEIIKAVRDAVGDDFIIIYRLSMLDLIEKGSDWDEIVMLAKAVEQAGASMINTGIGWHEARIPTIATMVPTAAFTPVTKKIKPEVSIPVITSNRINTPQQAEDLLASGTADIISMARPFLADAEFANKALNNRAQAINVCIACNQACLDRVFVNKKASCMVNPRACNETKLNYHPVSQSKKLAVVGAGPAGLAFATVAAKRGHRVTLFDRHAQIGGQFNLAKRIPGKDEFQKSLDYFDYQLKHYKVDVHLNRQVNVSGLLDYDEVILATGIQPRIPKIEGIEHPCVVSYIDIVSGKVKAGKRVAIIGAGGIGFDVAEYITHDASCLTTESFYHEWGIDISMQHRGGLVHPEISPSPREVFLLQRKQEKMGKRLGKTTGWVHRRSLKHKKVKMLSGVSYQKIDDQGLHLTINEKPQLLEVDTVIVCAGQLELKELYQPLQEKGIKVHLIGGASKALELDARHAIDQASRLAAAI